MPACTPLREEESRMTIAPHGFPRRAAALALAGLILPAAGQAEDPAAAEPGAPVARVRISQTQASLLGSVSWGSGTLEFEGQTRRFRIRGVGVGGIGITRMTARGNVYHLDRMSDFPGAYGVARVGVVAGNVQMRGGIWLQNAAGVQIHLRPERSGVALQVGADGILIEFE